MKQDLRKCTVNKRKYRGCGRWKVVNDQNFRGNRNTCRECERRIVRERKAEKEKLWEQCRDIVNVISAKTGESTAQTLARIQSMAKGINE